MSGQWLLPATKGVAPAPRGGHACVAVDSKVLIFGGADRTPTAYSDLHVLDLADDDGASQWTRISPSYQAGCQVQRRSGATLTALGKLVYLYGGLEPLSDTRFADIRVLDTDTWTWSDVQVTGPAPPPRHSHTTCALAGQCLLVYGGSGYGGSVLSDLWIFNSAQGSWSQPPVQGSFPEGREMHSAVMTDPMHMLVFGGRAADGRVLDDAVVLDVGCMAWGPAAATSFQRCSHCCVALTTPPPSPGVPIAGTAVQVGAGGSEALGAQRGKSASCRVWVWGGFTGSQVSGDVLCISPTTLEVQQVHKGPREHDKQDSVPTARFAAAATAVPWRAQRQQLRQAMLVVGGVSTAQDFNDVAIWLPASTAAQLGV